jgi:transposase
MMGTKVRSFSPLPHDISLEDLVPEDNFYRRLEARLDLSFVRELVGPLYAKGGRPSVDPVVFFKLQLVMFFEDLRSERQLMSVVADRLSLRWYLGYDLFEPLPDHSSLTRIRERYGLLVFPRFFERIVEECIEALSGAGRGAVLRRHQGRGQRLHGEPHPQVLSRSPPRWALRGRADARDRSATRDLGAFRRVRTPRPARGLRSRASGGERRKGRLDLQGRQT